MPDRWYGLVDRLPVGWIVSDNRGTREMVRDPMGVYREFGNCENHQY
jgi:hypothetical protein